MERAPFSPKANPMESIVDVRLSVEQRESPLGEEKEYGTASERGEEDKVSCNSKTLCPLLPLFSCNSKRTMGEGSLLIS